MMVKSGLEKIILKFHVPLQRYLLTSQANSALLGRFFCTGQQQLWRGTWNFKIIFSRPLFTIILSQKWSFQDLRFSSTYSGYSNWCVLLAQDNKLILSNYTIYLIAILFYRLTGTASSEDAAEWETLLTKGNADESVGSNKDLITGE